MPCTHPSVGLMMLRLPALQGIQVLFQTLLVSMPAFANVGALIGRYRLRC